MNARILRFITTICAAWAFFFVQAQQWVVVMTESDNDQFYLDGQYSFPEDWVQEKLVDYYFIKDVTYDDYTGEWCVVVSEDPALDDQRIELSYEFPSDWVYDMWDQGYDLEAIYYGDQWVVVMTRGSGRSDDYWATRETWADLEEFMLEQWGDGLDILNITYGNGLWAVAMAEADYADQAYNWGYDEIDWDWAQEKYDDGFNVSDVAYGDGRWVIVMTKYDYQVVEDIFLKDYFPESTIDEYWGEGRSITSLQCGTSSYYYDDYYYDYYGYYDDYYDDYSYECENNFSSDFYFYEFLGYGGIARGLQFDMSVSEVARMYDEYDIIEQDDELVQTLHWIDDDYCEFYYVYHYFDDNGLYYIMIETFLGNEDTEDKVFDKCVDEWSYDWGEPTYYESMQWWTAYDKVAGVDYTITVEPVDVEGIPGVDIEIYRQAYQNLSSNNGNDSKPGMDHLNGGNNNNNGNTTKPGQDHTTGGGNIDTYLRQAKIEMDSEDWDAALDNFDAALEIDDKNADALCGKAMCNIHLGNCTEAMLDSYLAMNTENTHRTTFTYGAALVCTGKCTDGMAKINDAIDDYEDALYYEYRALANVCLGDKESAIDDYEKAKDLDPSNRSRYQSEIDKLKPKNTNNTNNNNNNNDDDDIGRDTQNGRR